MEMDFNFAAVPAITVICFFVCMCIKAIGLNTKYIPIISMLFGAILGGICLYVLPGFPADDIITSIVIGIVSGGAATATHQIGKQLTSEGGDDV